MKAYSKITQILIAIEFAMVLFSTMMAQSQPEEFHIPQGWEVTNNWLPKFQEAFGTETHYGSFFSIMSESDFMLTNPDNQTFIFVWQEEVESKNRISFDLGKNVAYSQVSKNQKIKETNPEINISGMMGQHLADSRKIVRYSALQKANIHVLIISPRKDKFNVYHTNLLHKIANSWNPEHHYQERNITQKTSFPTDSSIKNLK